MIKLIETTIPEVRPSGDGGGGVAGMAVVLEKGLMPVVPASVVALHWPPLATLRACGFSQHIANRFHSYDLSADGWFSELPERFEN